LKKVKNRVVKGVIFGLTVFIFAQMMMAVMSAIFGGIIGHVIYGFVVSILVKSE